MIISFFVMLFLLGCNKTNHSMPLSTKKENFLPSIGIGTLVYKGNHKGEMSNIIILDSNKVEVIRISPWKNEIEALGKKMILEDLRDSIPIINLRPLEFDGEYEIIHFLCIDSIGEFYTIKSFDNSSRFFYLSKNEAIEFYTWEKYLLSANVYFDKNFYLYEKPSDNAKMKEFVGNVGLTVSEVRGEWIKVYCEINSPCEMCDNDAINGWVKWKDGNKILLDLRFSC